MNNFEKLINSDKPVVVDFSATWCGPCKMMHPVLIELKKKIGGKATIINMDIDKNPSYARQYNVLAVPTLAIFHKGKLIWRKSGVVAANEIFQQLVKFAD